MMHIDPSIHGSNIRLFLPSSLPLRAPTTSACERGNRADHRQVCPAERTPFSADLDLTIRSRTRGTALKKKKKNPSSSSPEKKEDFPAMILPCLDCSSSCSSEPPLCNTAVQLCTQASYSSPTTTKANKKKKKKKKQLPVLDTTVASMRNTPIGSEAHFRSTDSSLQIHSNMVYRQLSACTCSPYRRRRRVHHAHRKTAGSSSWKPYLPLIC
jgi:hypothetical protein